MKKYFLLFLFVSAIGFSQNLNDYKYAMVPSKFNFLKEENMYNLNALTKLFMEKYGFETYLSNETAPDDFIANNCNKVFVDVIPNNNIFTTRVKVVIKDCRGTILYTSEEGTSKDKEYKVAYNQALRMAFDNFSILKGHKYEASKIKEITVEDYFNTVKTVDDSKLNLKAIKVDRETSLTVIEINSNNVYMIIKPTSLKDIFIAFKENVDGILYKKENEWIFEFYKKSGIKIIQKLNIEF